MTLATVGAIVIAAAEGAAGHSLAQPSKEPPPRYLVAEWMAEPAVAERLL